MQRAPGSWSHDHIVLQNLVLSSLAQLATFQFSVAGLNVSIQLAGGSDGTDLRDFFEGVASSLRFQSTILEYYRLHAAATKPASASARFDNALQALLLLRFSKVSALCSLTPHAELISRFAALFCSGCAFDHRLVRELAGIGVARGLLQHDAAAAGPRARQQHRQYQPGPAAHAVSGGDLRHGHAND